jgi:hypothetical protein
MIGGPFPEGSFRPHFPPLRPELGLWR